MTVNNDTIEKFKAKLCEQFPITMDELKGLTVDELYEVQQVQKFKLTLLEKFPITMEELDGLTTMAQLKVVKEVQEYKLKLRKEFPGVDLEDLTTVEQLKSLQEIEIYKLKLQNLFPGVGFKYRITMVELNVLFIQELRKKYPGIEIDDGLTMSDIDECRAEYLLNHCHGWLVKKHIGIDVLRTNKLSRHEYPFVLPSLVEHGPISYQRLLNGLAVMQRELLAKCLPSRMKEWNNNYYDNIVDSANTYKQKCTKEILERQTKYLFDICVHSLRILEERAAAGGKAGLERTIENLQTQLAATTMNIGDDDNTAAVDSLKAENANLKVEVDKLKSELQVTKDKLEIAMLGLRRGAN